MFLVDAAIVLAHPPHAVARVVGRLHLMPRWCRGLRRLRVPAPGARAEGVEPSGGAACVFSYDVTDVRLVLRARTLTTEGDRVDEPTRAGAAPPGGASLPAAAFAVTHTAAGDGLTLTWTLTAVPCEGPMFPHAGTGVFTELRARVEVRVEAVHPLAAARAALCRVVARRVPTDLERLRVLLARYESTRT